MSAIVVNPIYSDNNLSRPATKPAVCMSTDLSSRPSAVTISSSGQTLMTIKANADDVNPMKTATTHEPTLRFFAFSAARLHESGRLNWRAYAALNSATGHFLWLVRSPAIVYHWTFGRHRHYQRSKACSRHICSLVPTSLTNCFQSTSSEHCTTPL